MGWVDWEGRWRVGLSDHDDAQVVTFLAYTELNAYHYQRVRTSSFWFAANDS